MFKWILVTYEQHPVDQTIRFNVTTWFFVVFVNKSCVDQPRMPSEACVLRFVYVNVRVTNVICITQTTLKLINYALFTHYYRFYFAVLKVFLYLCTGEHGYYVNLIRFSS